MCWPYQRSYVANASSLFVSVRAPHLRYQSLPVATSRCFIRYQSLPVATSRCSPSLPVATSRYQSLLPSLPIATSRYQSLLPSLPIATSRYQLRPRAISSLYLSIIICHVMCLNCHFSCTVSVRMAGGAPAPGVRFFVHRRKDQPQRANHKGTMVAA